MSDQTSPLLRLTNSLFFRLQLPSIALSLVGIFFGVRGYFYICEQFGEEKSLFTYHDLMIQTGIAILFNIATAFIIYCVVTKPIRTMCEVMRMLTEGKVDVDIPYVLDGTEIGSMARKVAIFKQTAVDKKALEDQQKTTAIKNEADKKQTTEKIAHEFESTVLSVVEVLATAADDMQSNAKELVKMADKTSEQSATVAAATEQTSVSVQTVAAAVEELSASIGDINHQVAESTRVSNEAVTEVRRADTTISTLSDAATQIGDVVKLIKDIAGQTNLLALNVTIEAARAGEAGKGFAVVASEVKSLADQTARATEEIAQKIATVQNVSTESVAAIRGIGKTIGETSKITGSISISIQQQTEAAREISRSIQQASIGTEKIASSIMDVTKDATESRNAADEVLGDSKKLLQQASLLQNEIKSFLGKIRQE
jgi:methyl-accepting chemotaxis protein